MGSVFGRRASYKGRCVKVLWRKRGAKASSCCNLATVADILDKRPRLALAFARAVGKTGALSQKCQDYARRIKELEAAQHAFPK
jgi:hypothetical protein